MSELPNKHVFVPQPPTEGERLAWNTVKASGEATKQLHDKLTAAQSRVVELERYVMELEHELAHVNCYGGLPASYSERIEKLLGDR